MKTAVCLTTALVLAFALPQVSTAQDQGRGNDSHGNKDHGKGNGKGHGSDNDRGRGQGHNDDRGGQRADRGGSSGRDDGARGVERRVERDVRDLTRDLDRPTVVVSRDGPVLVLRREPDRGLIAGCPPGLARKNNGCLPPGQARRMERARYDYLWNRRDDGFQYRYDDGYLYRLSSQGSVLGYLPVLGGALGLGNPWPAQYAYQQAPDYYVDYYRLNDERYDYRYADGVMYGLDPRTQAISQVAALLTGQQLNVGQPMPAGYDVYNVPYAYRDQYADGPDSLYRYNDGRVYQVDPTTQLIQAVIQLLV